MSDPVNSDEAARVRVLQRPNGLWHWWCPCCMGGDFAYMYGPVLKQALDHAQLPNHGAVV